MVSVGGMAYHSTPPYITQSGDFITLIQFGMLLSHLNIIFSDTAFKAVRVQISSTTKEVHSAPT